MSLSPSLHLAVVHTIISNLSLNKRFLHTNLHSCGYPRSYRYWIWLDLMFSILKHFIHFLGWSWNLRSTQELDDSFDGFL